MHVLKEPDYCLYAVHLYCYPSKGLLSWLLIVIYSWNEYREILFAQAETKIIPQDTQLLAIRSNTEM